METVIFDGVKFAAKLEQKLKTQVDLWVKAGGRAPKVVSIVFENDPTSRLYTQAKIEAAGRVGIDFEPVWLSFGCKKEKILSSIQKANIDQNITGVMIQKPRRKVWQEIMSDNKRVASSEDFQIWWSELTAAIAPEKDVDGLSPVTQGAIAAGDFAKKNIILPATVQAILQIMAFYQLENTQVVAIIGRSDLVGRPLYYVLKSKGYQVGLLGRRDLEERRASRMALQDFSLVISATGVAGLIVGSDLSAGTGVIDVGEPKGEVDWRSVYPKARFITPVPRGVGPVTVISLLANALACAKIQHSS